MDDNKINTIFRTSEKKGQRYQIILRILLFTPATESKWSVYDHKEIFNELVRALSSSHRGQCLALPFVQKSIPREANPLIALATAYLPHFCLHRRTHR